VKRPEPLTLREALLALTRELTAGGVESPAVEAERLLSHALGMDRTRLALDGRLALPAEVATSLAGLVQRRLQGEPLQHIEGSVAFRELELVADTRALIARPETEQLVELIRRSLPQRRSGSGPVRIVPRPGAVRVAEPVGRALDIGTGSGAIALSLAAEGIARQVVGVDTSAAAIEQAVENRQRAGLNGRVEFSRTGSDPFSALEAGDRFGIIVSNPPYVRDDEMADLPVEVRDFEPPEALRGGVDGLDLIRRIALQGPDYLEPSGTLYLEIGTSQAGAVCDLLAGAGRWTDVEVHPDLAGYDRFIVAGPR
jgi:release factor glutamine methyltransferase